MQKTQFIFKKLGHSALHILFWCAVLFFYSYLFAIGSSNYNDVFAFSLFLMPITIATTYVSIYKLIPEYFITKQYFRFVLYSLYTLVISSYLVIVSIFFSLIYLSGFEYSQMNPATKNILLVLSAVYLVVFIVSAFKLLKLNLKQSKITGELETKILEAQLKLKEQELNYLKMQIHPHFLFNTLNTMYGFALKKADDTPEMILKLSNLLDYLLYQVDKLLVPLTEEINHIKDYISLEQMRFNETLNIDFSESNCNETIEIAPMLFLPFIENSFKHGKIKDGKLHIEISFKYENNTILFNVKNSNSEGTTKNSGIGLENIKKRLELLYKNQYDLTISDNDSYFKVELKLALTHA
jgi:two-component system LytT family sensor kinase